VHTAVETDMKEWSTEAPVSVLCPACKDKLVVNTTLG
jgi:hypothetical protein